MPAMSRAAQWTGTVRQGMDRLLIGLSGARPAILGQYPSERRKFQFVGGSILFEVSAAIGSAWLAMYVVEREALPLALAASAAWGLAVIAADRWIVVSIASSRPLRPSVVVSRLTLTALIAVLVSAPFMLQIFQDQVNGQVTVIRHQRLAAFLSGQRASPGGELVAAWGNDVSNLQELKNLGGSPINPGSDPLLQSLIAQKADALTAENHYYKLLQCELYGGADCPAAGSAPLAQESENEYQQAAHQVAQFSDEIAVREKALSGIRPAAGDINYKQVVTELDNALQRLHSVVKAEEGQSSDFTTRNNADDGLLIRLQALVQLSASSPRAGLECSLDLAIFLAAFCLHALLELAWPAREYEMILNDEASRAAEQTGGSDRGMNRFWRRVGRMRAPAPPAGATSHKTASQIAPKTADAYEGPRADPGAAHEPGAARIHEPLAARLAGASGVQLGSGNVQYNYFNDNPDRAGSGGARPEPAGRASASASRGHAFISYVREDSAEVDALQETLEDAGIPVWRDTSSLWPGENWRAKIREAINADALVFIACFSTRSAARQRSYQNEELLLAIDQVRQRRPDDPWLIPVRLDDCDVPHFEIGAGQTLASINRADLFGPNRDQATRRLVEAVKRLLR
jgi:hypothetical protein